MAFFSTLGLSSKLDFYLQFKTVLCVKTVCNECLNVSRGDSPAWESWIMAVMDKRWKLMGLTCCSVGVSRFGGGGEEGTKGKRDDIFAGVGKTTAIRPAMGEIR